MSPKKSKKPTVPELAESMDMSIISIRQKVAAIHRETGISPDMEYREDSKGRMRPMQVCGTELVKEIKSRIKYRRVREE